MKYQQIQNKLDQERDKIKKIENDMKTLEMDKEEHKEFGSKLENERKSNRIKIDKLNQEIEIGERSNSNYNVIECVVRKSGVNKLYIIQTTKTGTNERIKRKYN